MSFASSTSAGSATQVRPEAARRATLTGTSGRQRKGSSTIHQTSRLRILRICLAEPAHILIFLGRSSASRSRAGQAASLAHTAGEILRQLLRSRSMRHFVAQAAPFSLASGELMQASRRASRPAREYVSADRAAWDGRRLTWRSLSYD
jgi:hypothetical protein